MSEARWSGELRIAPYPMRPDDTSSWVDRAVMASGRRLLRPVRRDLAPYRAFARAVERLSPGLAGLGDEALRHEAGSLRLPLRRGGFRDDLVARCFALVREASARRLGLAHYPTQIMGGYALIRGRCAEMATGEGKTITAALAAATAALAGRSVHVVTVNDYLAGRDAAELRPVYEALGLTVGTVLHDDDPAARRVAFGCDITYVTNKELAFDYLRDRVSLGRSTRAAGKALAYLNGEPQGAERPLMLRGMDVAIIDEADSVLVDEACTPLIISEGSLARSPESEIYAAALNIAGSLVRDRDFVLDVAQRIARLTNAGRRAAAERIAGRGGIFAARRAREELVERALSALHLYERDRHYIVSEGEVCIVDAATGRVAEGRSWEHGLHQMIELKEGCDITERRRTRASVTYQRFFGRYRHLCGMSGTVREVSAELERVYDLSVIPIPQHRPPARRRLPSLLMPDGMRKWEAIAQAAESEGRRGRPVLIGTRSIADSERLSAVLNRRGATHRVLNARQDKDEAEIVAAAGAAGQITVATAMAGRGTDIKLGSGVAAAGGLHVIIAGLNESARVDRQLIGRGGRQGDPTSYQEILAVDDELFNQFVPAALAWLAGRLPVPVFQPVLISLLRRLSQGRAEALGRSMRRSSEDGDRQRREAFAFAGEDD